MYCIATSLKNACEEKSRHDALLKQLTNNYLQNKVKLILLIVHLLKMPHGQAAAINREEFAKIFRGYDKVFGYTLFRLVFHRKLGILVRSLTMEYNIYIPSAVIKASIPCFNKNPVGVKLLFEKILDDAADNKAIDTDSLLGELIAIPEKKALLELKEFVAMLQWLLIFY
ncbi:unnamed protein product [Caenorhabditis angaria]|uniref:Uncharacterized protein n=1 Tax=Caenorhabditis angaria TaxID=860376 RepID=A0A9P1IC38_9PELO|nr:unnamed protein product [Caenorhabditis angaria]